MQEQIFIREFDKFKNETKIDKTRWCQTWKNPFRPDIENDYRRPSLNLGLECTTTPNSSHIFIIAESHNYRKEYTVYQLIIRINDLDNIILDESTVPTERQEEETRYEISKELLESICNANSLEFQTTIDESEKAEYRCFPNSEELKDISNSRYSSEFGANFQLYAQTFYNEVFDSNSYVKEHLHALQEIEAQKNREETKYQEDCKNESLRKFVKALLVVTLILIAIVWFYFLALA